VIGPVLAALSHKSMKRSAQAAYLSTRVAYQDLHAPGTACGRAESGSLEIAQEIARRRAAVAAAEELRDSRASGRVTTELNTDPEMFRYFPIVRSQPGR
jgi:hypothetical protein